MAVARRATIRRSRGDPNGGAIACQLHQAVREAARPRGGEHVDVVPECGEALRERAHVDRSPGRSWHRLVDRAVEQAHSRQCI